MKKIKTKRIVVLMLALTLLTCCFVGSTFAKYTSTATGSDSVTVAKWDIKAGVTGSELSIQGGTVAFNLFETIKDTDPAQTETDVVAGKIAPGTSGSFTLSIKNDSEVNAKYTIALDEENNDNVPLQYSVDGTTWYDSIAEVVMTELTDVAINMNNSDNKTVHWRWMFNDTDTAVADGTTSTDDAHAGQTNATDTALGWAGTATVTITATLTVEQVD